MPLHGLSTNTDPRSRRSWRINDLIIRLREWARCDRHYDLPEPPVPLKIGSAPSCELQLTDPNGLLSREHALLMPVASGGWKIRDCESKNGIRRDGSRDPCFRLYPGVEITIGSLRLIAESEQFIALRSVVCRFLGWEENRQGDVDDALHALRSWAAQDLDLVVLGDGDLTPVLARLHRLTLGVDAPFTTYDGGDVSDVVRATARGTLHVPRRPGEDASEVINKVRSTPLPLRPQLVVSASLSEAAAPIMSQGRTAVVALSPLSSRTNEIERILHESAIDVAREMGVRSPGFIGDDDERLRALTFTTIDEIEDTVRRLIAIRAWGVSLGSARLGITHPSLSGWARRRKLAT